MGCSTQKKDTEQASGCEVSAHSLGLITSLCKLKTGIKDKNSKVILACMTEEEKNIDYLNECKKRQLLKKNICKKLIRLNRTKKGLISCTQDKEFDKKWGSGQI